MFGAPAEVYFMAVRTTAPLSLKTQLKPYLFQKGVPRAFVHSFGCQLNVSDGERIRGVLQNLGYQFTDKPENANLILFNTCAVRASAESRLYGILGSIKHLKEKNPNQIVVLCGCMAAEKQTAEFVRAHYPYVDILFSPSALSRFPALLLEHFQGNKFACDTGEYDKLYEGFELAREHPFRAFVPVMFGCNNFCTYCIVPYVRGRERSREPKNVLREVRDLVQRGYREIMLLGQNVNSYGKDLSPPVSFASLLRQIDAIPGDFVVRFLSSHPKDVTTELLDTILHGQKIEHHLHLPVQSGSDEILRRMNRRYTRERYFEIVDYLRAKDPGFSLSSDILVGFPSERDADFAETLDLVSRVKFDNIYTFIYSKRPGTKAADMPDLTTSAEKRARMEQLLSLQRDISTQSYKRFLGQTLCVLVQEKSKRAGYLLGKDNAGIIVEFPGAENLLGTWTKVHITKTYNWATEGVMA